MSSLLRAAILICCLACHHPVAARDAWAGSPSIQSRRQDLAPLRGGSEVGCCGGLLACFGRASPEARGREDPPAEAGAGAALGRRKALAGVMAAAMLAVSILLPQVQLLGRSFCLHASPHIQHLRCVKLSNKMKQKGCDKTGKLSLARSLPLSLSPCFISLSLSLSLSLSFFLSFSLSRSFSLSLSLSLVSLSLSLSLSISLSL